MPYPASPPTPPAIIATPFNDVSHSLQAPLVASNLESIQKIARQKKQPRLVGSLADNPAAPASSPADSEAESLPLVATFVEQAGVSQAALLGSSTTTGYLLQGTQLQGAQRNSVFNRLPQAAHPKEAVNGTIDTVKADWQPQRPGKPQAPAVIPLPAQTRSIASQPLTDQATPTQPAAVERSAAATLDASQSVVYSFSGTTQTDQTTRESAVMSGLSEAIVLDEFAQETLAQEETGTPGKPGYPFMRKRRIKRRYCCLYQRSINPQAIRFRQHPLVQRLCNRERQFSHPCQTPPYRSRQREAFRVWGQ